MKKQLILLVSAVSALSLPLALRAQDTPPLPMVTVEATVPETSEPIPFSLAPERPGVFTISRTGPTTEPLDVYIKLRGTAVNGEDYMEIPDHVTIPAEAVSAMVIVGALSDELSEGDEAVVLSVLPPPCLNQSPPAPHCYIAGIPDQARVIIHDYDGPPVPIQPVVNIIAADPIAHEQSPDLTIPPDVAIFHVARRGPTDIPLDVYISIHGSAENGVDYVDEGGQPLPERIVIPEGEEFVPIVLFPIDDELPERKESVVIRLEPIACPEIWPPPAWCYVIGDRPVAEAVIHDNDAPPVNQLPNIAIARPAAGEVFTPPARIDILVEANDPNGWVQTVELFANDRKIDEQSIFFIVAPPPGQDQVFSFVWEGAPPGHYALVAQATDNQGGKARSEPVPIGVRETPEIPVVNIWATDPFAREEMPPHHPPNSARFRVRRNGPIDQPLSIDYEIGGTATNGEDYESITGHATIPADRRSAAIHILPIDDEIPEGLETVILKLFVAVDVEPPPYRVGRYGKAGAVIVDRDHPTPMCRTLHDGMIYLRRHAQNGEILDVQVTDRLGGEWESIGTLTVEDGAVHFADPDAADRATRYYRFVPAPANAIAIDD